MSRLRVLSRLMSTKQTHFGFETVTESEKAEKVSRVFDSVASKYDTMNDAMSFGVHRCWKDRFVDVLNVAGKVEKALDVAGGTGDVAFRILGGVCDDVTICDINPNMLAEGEKRFKSLRKDVEGKRLEFIVGDAQKLPFESNSFDVYTIAFGIRNVVDIPKALQEAHRVLKPGGRFLCLEFCPGAEMNPIIGQFYDFYSFEAIPALGAVLAGDWNSYQYLVESIRKFPSQTAFREMIRQSGFGFVTHEDLTLGVAAIHSGFKL